MTYSGKHIVILGLARQGTALVRFFAGQGARITVSDLASADQLAEPLAALAEVDSLTEPASVRLVLGGHPLSLLDGCDLLCLSGGVPPQIPLVRAARRQGIPLANDTLLTIERSPAPAMGITGSSGKTTTTTLVGLMLAAGSFQEPPSGRRQTATADQPHVWVGGNIGTPLIDRLDQIRPHDRLVLELSSFQLELFDRAAGGQSLSPTVAAVLNVTPNHLDRHPSMANYTACKANILRWQGLRDVAVLGADDPVTGRWLRECRVEVEAGQGQPALSFALTPNVLGFGTEEAVGEGCWLIDGRLVLWVDGRERPIMPVDAIKLRGRHNVLNVMAACAVAAAASVEPPAMAEVARSFGGVAHRMELVRTLNGVQWINDSIATAPERAAAALRSYHEPIVLLAGGKDKNLPWSDFARLVHERVKHLVLFGAAAELIAGAVRSYPSEREVPITPCADLAEAVAAAARLAGPGDVALLSPGGTSYDAYKDFEARGRHFRDLVEAL